ncbi:MAG: insulinase family protein [Candidatus Moduliflexus flocculans]|nr:insulinase family protein [Candidatus Moduliflexus flocculans]
MAVAYGAGTIREKPAQEGLAYLLENLMFQGSENVPPSSTSAIVQKVGGELNATTTADKALFYETLPSNYLALALWLESDRMKSLAITPGGHREDADRRSSKAAPDRLASDPLFRDLRGIRLPPLPGRSLRPPPHRDGRGAELILREAGDRWPSTRPTTSPTTPSWPSSAISTRPGRGSSWRGISIPSRRAPTCPRRPVPSFDPAQRRRRPHGPRRHRTAPASTWVSGSSPSSPGDVYALRILEYLLAEGETSRLRDRLIRQAT